MHRHLIGLLALSALILTALGSADASIRRHQPADSANIDTRLRSHAMCGLRAGMVFGNRVTVERSDGPRWRAKYSSGFSIGAYLELPSPQWTTAAIDLNFYNVRPDGMPPEFDKPRWMPDVGVVLKPSIRRDHIEFAIRPMLGISYGRLSGEANVVSATNFMIIKLGGEGLYFFSKRTGLLVEALLVAAPYGRASAKGPGSIIDDQPVRYNLTTHVRPMIRLGLAYR